MTCYIFNYTKGNSGHKPKYGVRTATAVSVRDRKRTNHTTKIVRIQYHFVTNFTNAERQDRLSGCKGEFPLHKPSKWAAYVLKRVWN